MADADTLPPALTPWAGTLSFLDLELAVALGPMVQELDRLVTLQELTSSSEGDIAGWAGTTNRGDPERLLVSEWALAAELPWEFLRRAASAELRYLEPAYEKPSASSTTDVLVDVGPDQLGPCRLAHLAALVVLHRRARAAGSTLRVGLMGDEPGRWLTGDFDAILAGWLTGRRSVRPRADDARWLDEVGDPAATWVIGGEQLGRLLPAGPRVLTVRELAWDAGGARTLEVTVGSVRAELLLPAPDVGVRALRSPLRRHRTRDPGAAAQHAGARCPLFSSYGAKLLMRGETADEILAVSIMRSGGEARVRRHRFPGAVLAAATVGTRLVALVEQDGWVVTEIRGKPLGDLASLRVGTAQLLEGADSVTQILTGLRAVFFDRGSLLWRSPLGWVRLRPGQAPQVLSTVTAVAAGSTVDRPRLADSTPQGLHLLPEKVTVRGASSACFGPDGLCATTVDGTTWALTSGPDTFRVEAGSEVLGLVDLGEGPALVSVSPGGLVVRLHTSSATKTLTQWSGGLSQPSLHPTEPWLAVHTHKDVVEVADLASGQRLWRLSAPRSAA